MNDIAVNKTFQEKLEERIRTDIGELMPDEALAEIVTRAIEKSFFEERTVEDGTYTYQKRKQVPWVVQVVRELLEARVEAAVKTWVSDNPDAIKKVVQERLDEGIASAFVKSINNLMQAPVMELQNSMNEIVRRLSQ